MATGVRHTGFYFMNGIMNNDEHGSKTTDKIQRIVQNGIGFQPHTTFVTFHHNDSATQERVLIEVAVCVLGAAAIVYAIDRETKKEGDILSRTVGCLGVMAIIGAVVDYKKMQDDKNRIASEFATRVSKFLEEDELNVANLILHSQGADVGYRSLEILSPYKSRIRAITLGAMTTIPKNMCAQVTNYKFNNDWVSRLMASPFEMIRETTDNMGERPVIFLNTEGPLTHGIEGYLEEEAVQKRMLSLLN